MLGDGHGDGVHLGERDCSLQRRHQKVLEEAPSPALNAEQRDRIGELAADAVRKLELSRRRHHRVPVPGRRVLLHRDEHPPAGRASDHRGGDRHRPGARADPHRRRRAAGASARRTSSFQGHAIECRINAENPETFAPSPGMVTDYHPPGRPGRARRYRRSTPATRSRPIYDSHGGQADRQRPRPQRVPDAAAPLARGVRDRRHRDHHPAAPEASSQQPDFIDGDYNIHWLEKLVGLKK